MMIKSVVKNLPVCQPFALTTLDFATNRKYWMNCCRAWWHYYRYCYRCATQWMNEWIFQTMFQISVCCIMHLLLFVFFCRRWFGFRWNLLWQCKIVWSFVPFLHCIVVSLLLVLPFEAGFARWKRKFSACDNIPIKISRHCLLSTRQTRAIKSTSKSEIRIVVRKNIWLRPIFMPTIPLIHRFIYNLSILLTFFMYLVCGHDILIRVILLYDMHIEAIRIQFKESKSHCLKMDL